MNQEKRQIISWSVVLLVLLAIAGSLLYCLITYHVVDFRFYPKDAASLDLRGQDISLSHYQRLSDRMPDCEILWDIPFQGKLYPSDTKELTVTSLTEDDLVDLAVFEELEALHAQACQDYPQLLTARQMYPRLKIDYQVTLGGKDYPQNSKKITVTGLNAQEIPTLQYLLHLQSVTLSGSQDPQAVSELLLYAKSHGIEVSFQIGGKSYGSDVEELSLREPTAEDIAILPSLPNLKTVHMRNPAAPAEALLALVESCPKAEITWDQVISGELVDQTTTELDLSKMEITTTAQVEELLAYFPNVKTVFLGEVPIENEELAAFRDKVREQYKVVWLIHLGDSKGTLRTDITYFFPGRDGGMGGYVFNDNTSYNLRYCEDLICVDVGHLGVHDISWLTGLKNLEYLILAHTGVISLEGIENCKKLKFLEIHWTGVRDLTPLKELTALEDLNFGETWPDVTALTEMPWLKNVYLIGGSGKSAALLTEALPDTRVVSSGSATVASGWRRLPNYYAMRDALNAPYMN